MFPFIKKFLLLGSFFLSSCAGLPPSKDYSLARSALSIARKYGAEELASGHYRKAFDLYRKGQSFFKDRFYALAQDKFLESMEYSEKAENISRLKKYRKGDFSN